MKKAICLMDERKEFAIKNLTNKLITKVTFQPRTYYWSKEEYPDVLALHLHDGQVLIPSIDEEGNAPGVLFTNIKWGMYI
tara:strand:- start:991 stop:1230 length:240 start_codon:yes stop_codon:yes gene_type:complete